MDKIYHGVHDSVQKTFCGIKSRFLDVSFYWGTINCLRCLKKGMKDYPRNKYIKERYRLIKYKEDFQELIDE